MLKAENKALLEKLMLLEKGRKSSTSHTPSSQDFSKGKIVNLREKTNKKSGGQKGHEGNTLEFNSNPTETIIHHPIKCDGCGLLLKLDNFKILDCRQVVDIPPIIVSVLEHQISQVKCTCCSNINVGVFPKGVEKSVQYGPNLVATIGYLNVEQYLPFKRTKQLLKDLFSIDISEGTIYNFIKRLAENAKPAYEEIRVKIENSKLVGGDETGSSFNGEKGWFHVWQNQTLTYIVASANRGFATVEKYFSNGFVNAVYVSDCWAAQMKINSNLKQICTAHIQREVKKFIETFQCQWATELKSILKDSLELKYKMERYEYQYNKEVDKIKNRLHILLQQEPISQNNKLLAFVKRIRKYEDHLLTFLTIYYVPPDNNGSERAIRNVKVKTKVSTCFRSLAGATNYAILRSIVDTARKNNMNTYNVFSLLAKI